MLVIYCACNVYEFYWKNCSNSSIFVFNFSCCDNFRLSHLKTAKMKVKSLTCRPCVCKLFVWCVKKSWPLCQRQSQALHTLTTFPYKQNRLNSLSQLILSRFNPYTMMTEPWNMAPGGGGPCSWYPWAGMLGWPYPPRSWNKWSKNQSSNEGIILYRWFIKWTENIIIWILWQQKFIQILFWLQFHLYFFAVKIDQKNKESENTAWSSINRK